MTVARVPAAIISPPRRLDEATVSEQRTTPRERAASLSRERERERERERKGEKRPAYAPRVLPALSATCYRNHEAS